MNALYKQLSACKIAMVTAYRNDDKIAMVTAYKNDDKIAMVTAYKDDDKIVMVTAYKNDDKIAMVTAYGNYLIMKIAMHGGCIWKSYDNEVQK